MAGLKLVLVLLVWAAVAAPLTVDAAITCGAVAGRVGPCFAYLQKGGALSPGCCKGVKDLNSDAKTTADRRAICNCLKKLATGVDPSKAAGLPGKCGVSVPFPISTSTNCAIIN